MRLTIITRYVDDRLNDLCLARLQRVILMPIHFPCLDFIENGAATLVPTISLRSWFGGSPALIVLEHKMNTKIMNKKKTRFNTIIHSIAVKQ